MDQSSIDLTLLICAFTVFAVLCHVCARAMDSSRKRRRK